MANLQNVSFHCVKMTDGKILKAISKISDESGIKINTAILTPGIGGQQIQASFPDVLTRNELQELLNYNSELIKGFSFRCEAQMDISINRSANTPHDEVTISLSKTDESQRGKASSFVSSARKFLKAMDSQETTRALLGEAAAKHYELREAELSRLEGIAEKLVYKMAEHSRELVEEAKETRDQLQAEFDAKGKGLEAEHNKKLEALLEREKGLEARLKEIDDRESKHVRRMIRQDLKTEFKNRGEKFQLTAGTRDLRKPIYRFTVILLCFFGLGMLAYFGLSVYEILFKSPALATSIALGVKSLAFALAFGATSVFFIRWNNRWFEQHANEEFRLKRHAIDLDRASWLVEMALEWKEEKGAEIPKELIEKLARNLFPDITQADVPLHPSDQLASALLGASAGVCIPLPGGGELKLDRKSVKDLDKKA